MNLNYQITWLLFIKCFWMLKKCLGYPTFNLHVDGLGFDENLSYKEGIVEILDRQVKRLRNKEVAIVKMYLKNHLVERETREAEDDMRSHYIHWLSS